MMLTSQILLLATLSVSQPTPDQIKSVFEYHYKGEGDPIVADAFLCSELEKKKKDTKWDCITRTGTTATKGAAVNVYLYFLVPKGVEKELMVQALHNGVVRQTKDFTIKGRYLRERTWKQFTLKKAGKWEFKVLDGANVMKTIAVDVE